MSCYNSRATLRPPNAGCKPTVITTVKKIQVPVGTPMIAPVLKLVQTSPTQIIITWNEVVGATSYQLERSTTSDFSDSTIIYNNTTTSYIDNNISQGIQYYYKVTPITVSSSVASLPPVGSITGLPYILPFILS